MARLNPSYFLDFDLYKVTLKLLSKPESRSVWEQACSDVVDDLRYGTGKKDREEANLLDSAAWNSKNLKKLDPLTLGKVLSFYVEDVLSNWTSQSTDGTADQMIQSLPLFIEMSKHIPGVNPADKYKAAFRGTEFNDTKLHSFIKRTKPTDWKRVRLMGDPFMSYVGPLKNGFIYKPHRPVQSWSVSDKAAKGFGSTIVATAIDDSFFFDPKFTGTLGRYEHEKETVHFGKSPMKVALMVPKEDYDDLKSRARVDEDTTGSNEIQDDEGTLIIPGI